MPFVAEQALLCPNDVPEKCIISHPIVESTKPVEKPIVETKSVGWPIIGYKMNINIRVVEWSCSFCGSKQTSVENLTKKSVTCSKCESTRIVGDNKRVKLSDGTFIYF